jgi:hypothetical protein
MIIQSFCLLLIIVIVIDITFRKKIISFRCWFSKYFWDIHTEKDAISNIPDHFKEYKCKKCNKSYKL